MNKTIYHVRTPAGQRLYDVESFLATGKQRRTILYARVSSRNQQDDLASQVRTLKQRYPEYEFITSVSLTSQNKVVLHCGDCLEVMRSFPENSVDAVVSIYLF